VRESFLAPTDAGILSRGGDSREGFPRCWVRDGNLAPANLRDARKSPRRHGEEMLIEEKLTGTIIGAAIEVHRELGPGLLESAYEKCLCHEIGLRGLSCDHQVELPLCYKGILLDCGYRIDILVENAVIIEVKAVEQLVGIHEAQLLTYMRLSSKRVGLLMNFHSTVLKDGIIRKVL
jgi:GxxExxY protein